MAQGFQQTPSNIAAAVSAALANWVVLADASSLTLADLTQYTNPPVIVAPANATTVPSAITMSNGWTVQTGFVAGTAGIIAPKAIPAPQGVWGTAEMRPPALATILGVGVNSILGTVLLDPGLVAVLYFDDANVKVACVNLTTNAATAAPVTLGSADTANGAAIFRTAANGYVAFYSSVAGGIAQARAGTVDAALVITQGAQNTVAGGAPAVTPVQLSATSYVTRMNGAAGLGGVDVTGTVVTMAAPLASGSINDATATSMRIARASATQVFIMYLAAGGATATTRLLSSRIGTVAAGTGVITLSAGVASPAGNVFNDTLGISTLVSLVDGATYLTACQLGATPTSCNFQAVTVAGTVPTIGASTTRVNEAPTSTASPGTFIYKQTGLPAIKYDATTVLLGHLAAGPYAMTVTPGTTLTFGGTLALGAVTTFMKDAATDSLFFARSATTFDKLAVAGTALTSTRQVVATVSTIFDENMTDTAVNFAGTWYVWKVLPVAVLSATRILVDSSTNFLLCGPVQ